MHPDQGFQAVEMTIPIGISGLLPSLLPLVPGLFHQLFMLVFPHFFPSFLDYTPHFRFLFSLFVSPGARQVTLFKK